MRVRLATWNLEHGGGKAARRLQADRLREVAADVAVLTEPAPAYVDSQGTVVSPRGPDGGLPWIAIDGQAVEPVEPRLPYERLGLVARVNIEDTAFLIYGTVLPWSSVRRDAPAVGRPDEDSLDVFRRVLHEQVSDILELRRRFDLPVLWIGDFNCAVVGSTRAGALDRRRLLLDALGTLDLAVWNGDEAHAIEGLSTIDLICGPKGVRLESRGRIDPVRDGVRLSDHAGYWVEFEPCLM